MRLIHDEKNDIYFFMEDYSHYQIWIFNDIEEQMKKYNMDLLFSDLYPPENENMLGRRTWALLEAIKRFQKNNPTLSPDDFDFEVVYDDGNEVRVRCSEK